MGIVNLNKIDVGKKTGKKFLVSFEAHVFILHLFEKFRRSSRPVKESVLLPWTDFLISSNKVRCLFTLKHTS
jgi:hypothetical protein